MDRSVAAPRRALVAAAISLAAGGNPAHGVAQSPAAAPAADAAAAAFLSGIHALLRGLNETLGDSTSAPGPAGRPATCAPSEALALLSEAPAAVLRTQPVPDALAPARDDLVDAAAFIGEGFRFLDKWLACGDVAARLVADDLYLAARTKLRLAREALAVAAPVA